jgi:2-keto-4-pentenoate hydratase/2-oxohepta-3-ene-1,7-dioic acid hydratase in catechol pathway
MKLATYEINGEVKVGVIGNDHGKIVPVSALGYNATEMTEFIREIGGKLPEEKIAAIDAAQGDLLAQCRLLSPIPQPAQDILCLGVNYKDHQDETIKAGVAYDKSKASTIYFGKRLNRAVGPNEYIDGHFNIVDSLDYEVELAVVIGKDAKDVAIEDVKDYILGYTIVNDISARNLQKKHQQWYFGKSLDDFTPIGPWIVTADEFDGIPQVGIRCYVNGELRQNSNTKLLINPIDFVIHELSQGMTLKAGTIIATGTPSGVAMGMDPQPWLQSGDVIRCEIDGIGVLENTVK